MSEFRKLLLLALLPLILAACQKGTVREDGHSFEERGETTGRMGELRGPSPADVYVSLAGEYLKTRQYKNALINGKKATIVDPGNPRAHLVLALSHEYLGEYDLAQKHFKKAVKLDSHDPFVLNAYGTFLCSQKQFDKAEGYFMRAVDNPLYPTPWMAFTNAGICAYENGKIDQSEVYFRQALLKNKSFPQALLRMAQVSFDKEQYLSSRAYLQRYLEVAPHTSKSLWLGIQTERVLGDKDKVASYSLLLNREFPDSFEAKQLQESGG